MADKSKEKKTRFIDGVKAEYGKISWPSRPELLRKSGVVLIVSIILGVIISIVDGAALQLFRLFIG